MDKLVHKELDLSSQHETIYYLGPRRYLGLRRVHANYRIIPQNLDDLAIDKGMGV